MLIVACPCALTLSAPITLGTAMGELGRRGFFLKHAAVALDLSRIDTVIFDKTGTLTAGPIGLSRAAMASAIAAGRSSASSPRESLHPISRASRRRSTCRRRHVPAATDVREVPGHGIAGTVGGVRVAIGSARVRRRSHGTAARSGRRPDLRGGRIETIGWVRASAAPRAGIHEAAGRLAAAHDIRLLSGDHADRVVALAPAIRPRDALPAVAGGQAGVRRTRRRPKAGAC